jgi:A/G-specific adenine glycosylase
MGLSDTEKTKFQTRLLVWFEQNQRFFPWRLQTDPYAILVAEKLLQQTAARDSVVEAYQTIIGNYPTPETLSRASTDDLERVIYPLGFSYRAAQLIEMAADIVEKYQGNTPSDLKSLLSIKGIGDYSARAVLSFAYGLDVPIVDTNVARFLYRIFGLEGKLPANPARKRSLIELAGSLVPPRRSKVYNFAILDLCALVCKSRSPLCSKCPVLEFCSFGLNQINLDSPLQTAFDLK